MIALWIVLGVVGYVGVWIVAAAVLDVIDPEPRGGWTYNPHPMLAMLWPGMIFPALLIVAAKAIGRASDALAARIVARRQR